MGSPMGLGGRPSPGPKGRPHLNFEFKFESDFESKFESDFESDFASDSESPAVKTPGRQGPM